MDRHQNVDYLLHDFTRLYKRRFEERAGGLALTLPQCKTLTSLSRNEGVSQKRLAELVEVDPMTLVRILDRMEADGWVQRRSDPVDRRARSLVVTQKARPILEEILRLAQITRSEVLAGISDAERTQLVDLLERMHANLVGLPPLAPAEETDPGTAARRAPRSIR